MVLIALLLAALYCNEEVEQPPLDSLLGYWKYFQIDSQEGGGIVEDIFAVYWFKDNGNYDYLYWSESYSLIKIKDMRSGTWSLSGNLLTLIWKDHPDQVFEIEYTSEAVIFTLIGASPSNTREYKFEEHPWIPVDYRAQFSLPAADPS